MNKTLTSEKLRSIRHVVTHANCPDGAASALILFDALTLPVTRIWFAQHGQNTITNGRGDKADLASLVSDGPVLFCDWTPPATSINPFAAAGAVFLDHHEGCQALIQGVAEEHEECFSVYADNTKGWSRNWSGATLAYSQVYVPLRGHCDPIERMAHLAGVRDTWDKRDPEQFEQASAQAAALMFWPVSELLNRRRSVTELTAIGPILLEKRRADAREVFAGASPLSIEDPRGGELIGLCFDGVVLSSDVADLAAGEGDQPAWWSAFADGDHDVQFDFVAGCLTTAVPEGHAIRYSLRRRNPSEGGSYRFDLLDFCKANGGGGHANAAGFTLRTPKLEHPYKALTFLIQAWLYGKG